MPTPTTRIPLLLALLLGIALTGPAAVVIAEPAGEQQNIEVLVLGTYHMAGSSQDLINVEVDSILGPERQQELAALASALARFRPNVVVTERVTEAPDYLDPVWPRFDDAMLAENQNERVQVAYRLARAAGVERVYGLDEQPSEGEPDYFPFGQLQAHAQATGQLEDLEALINESRTMIEALTAASAAQPIAEKLKAYNTGPMASPDFYYRLASFDEGEAQPAAELQAYWFMRNAKIFSKLVDVTRPGDRVVVVYGAGHKFWLDHLVEQTPGFTLVDPIPYLDMALQ